VALSRKDAGVDGRIGTETARTAEAYLELPIKQVIERFPQVGAILSEYEVGCVDCGLGSCLLRDVVAIHDLSPSDEEALLSRISGVLFPGEDVRLSVPQPRAQTGASSVGGGPSGRGKGESKYSPPLRRLVEEHVLIMRWVHLVPRLLAVIDLDRPEDRELVLGGVDFIRSYADRFHHAKEEDILFKYFDEGMDIIQVMLSDHETARAHVRAVEDAVTARDQATVAEHLRAYADLLTEHIKKEDTILYPWMDRQLSTAQVGDMFARFAEVEAAAQPGFADRCARLVEQAEQVVAQRQESEGET
jgi:hemerythrin-like domain-containing protein